MRRAARCLRGRHSVDHTAHTACPAAETRLSLTAASSHPISQPHVRHLFGIDLEKIKKYDEQRKKRKWEKRDEIRKEIRALPIRQMQTLLTDKKPNDIATPLYLSAAPLAPYFMPMSPPCIATSVEKQEVLLPQHLWGKITFLHLSFNQFAFDLGRKWCDAAAHFASLPLSTPPAPSTAATPPTTAPAAPAAVEVSPFDFYQISLIKNPFVRHWFGDYSLSSFRTTTPPHLHRHLLSLLSDAAYNTLTAQEPVLQLVRHELMGFVFLLDARGRIRWRAWSGMTEEDREVLGRMVGELREEDARDRRREAERMRLGVESKAREATSGVKGGKVYGASASGKQVNGQNGSAAAKSASNGEQKVERAEGSMQTETAKADGPPVKKEAAAVAKG